ncbi:hypothetical protein Cgig2_014000 [Carnegiea gigantea]|uniref:Rab-GAP TBC domain-containing protein n=1 Tax=Carnegiea gigantea TaxID=171969 RepID=A0A9Q1QQ84_9CARY|nr:hypothetical protein Cgig2_014000 [Carnegiea gigantea]
MKMKMKIKPRPSPATPLEHKRDAYGFTVRPQHVQRYREYANIYKEEEEERSDRWRIFLERVSESAQLRIDGLLTEAADREEGNGITEADVIHQAADNHPQVIVNRMDTPISDGSVENGFQNLEALAAEEKKIHEVQIWSEIRSSLHPIEDMMSVLVKKRSNALRKGQDNDSRKALQSVEESRSVKRAGEEDSEEEFYDVDRLDLAQDVPSSDINASHGIGSIGDGTNLDSSSPWKEELEVLVRGGLPMALRGELWQAFVGVKVRRIANYYQELLSPESNHCNEVKQQETNGMESDEESLGIGEKWKRQIEKDLPRTFPGHPALDEDGRNALRRLLIAYARHNPSVGYCQVKFYWESMYKRL